jgi:hypothetical protein
VLPLRYFIGYLIESGPSLMIKRSERRV